jgi:hypothetical protein
MGGGRAGGRVGGRANGDGPGDRDGHGAGDGHGDVHPLHTKSRSPITNENLALSSFPLSHFQIHHACAQNQAAPQTWDGDRDGDKDGNGDGAGDNGPIDPIGPNRLNGPNDQCMNVAEPPCLRTRYPACAHFGNMRLAYTKPHFFLWKNTFGVHKISIF